MYLVAFHCSSSMLDAGFLHKLFTKGLDLSVLINWFMVTTRSRFQIIKAIFLKRSMKVQSDYFFFCDMLT